MIQLRSQGEIVHKACENREELHFSFANFYSFLKFKNLVLKFEINSKCDISYESL